MVITWASSPAYNLEDFPGEKIHELDFIIKLTKDWKLSRWLGWKRSVDTTYSGRRKYHLQSGWELSAGFSGAEQD